MQRYTIKCAWQMYASVDIDAEDLADAKDILENMELPLEFASYVEDSFEIDNQMLEEDYPEEYNLMVNIQE